MYALPLLAALAAQTPDCWCARSYAFSYRPSVSSAPVPYSLPPTSAAPPMPYSDDRALLQALLALLASRQVHAADYAPPMQYSLPMQYSAPTYSLPALSYSAPAAYYTPPVYDTVLSSAYYTPGAYRSFFSSGYSFPFFRSYGSSYSFPFSRSFSVGSFAAPSRFNFSLRLDSRSSGRLGGGLRGGGGFRFGGGGGFFRR